MEKALSRQFYPKNYDFAILFQNFIHDWQVRSICCKSSPYEQAKEFNDFQFYYFPFKPETTQIKIHAFLNNFSISGRAPAISLLEIGEWVISLL